MDLKSKTIVITGAASMQTVLRIPSSPARLPEPRRGPTVRM